MKSPTPLQRPNTTIDDVCALVGFTRTVLLIQWQGGTNLYVPADPNSDHPIARLIGQRAMARLIEEFGGTTVWVPNNLGGQHTEADKLKRQVRDLILKGHGSRVIGEIVGTSQRQVQRIRADLEAAGLLPEILGEKCLEKTP